MLLTLQNAIATRNTELFLKHYRWGVVTENSETRIINTTSLLQLLHCKYYKFHNLHAKLR